jgi:hypothetical protein
MKRAVILPISLASAPFDSRPKSPLARFFPDRLTIAIVSSRHDERKRCWNDGDEQRDSNSHKPILYLLFALLRQHGPLSPSGRAVSFA